MAAYTIETWLRGKVDFDIPEAAIKAILFDNSVADGTPMSSVAERERDLCLADLYMWLSSSSTATSGETISDGGWSHQKSNKQVVNRAEFANRAKELYAKWKSDKAKAPIGARITIKSIY